jgi:oxygen-dependent protoporphyrinogen oxidase
MRVAVVGGGVAGLAATRRLEALLPEAELVLVEKDGRLGGKIRTERVNGFVIEAAPDSFLSRKQRGVGLAEELGLGGELVGRRPENERTFVKRSGTLHPLPAGLTGMIPTNLDALATSDLLTPKGKARLAAEVDLPPAGGVEDESIAAFVSRRLGREAYEILVEPLMTGIFGGDGERLSLRATFPGLRSLELEHGSVIRGLLAQSVGQPPGGPPFLALRSGMDTLVSTLVERLRATRLLGRAAARVEAHGDGRYVVELEGGESLEVNGVVLAVPAFAAATILADLDGDLASLHAEIPHASSALVTLAYRRDQIPHPFDGYGYVVPRVEGSDVLACTWTSSKWEARAPENQALVRVYAGRFGGPDVTSWTDEELVELGRAELGTLGVEVEPHLTRVRRWPNGMPQYVLGHPERIERIETGLEAHPGLALAGAAYRGIGIPDCIRSGEDAAQSVAHALERVPR